jgi:hypothetical protein
VEDLAIALDEDVARWARDRAAQENVSISHLVGDILRERMVEAAGYESARERYLARAPVALKSSGRYPGREELHDGGDHGALRLLD